MALECTLVRAPGAAETAEPEELSIAVPVGASGTRVQQLLTDARGTGVLSVGGRLLSSLTVGQPPLITGAVLVDDAPPHRGGRILFRSLMLLTHTGPGAGSIFRIHRGRYRIGRASPDIPVSDPAMSREHAILEVSSTALAVRAVSGANPVFVDDRSTNRTLLSSSSSVRCGNSTFTVAMDGGSYPPISVDAGLSIEEPLEVRHTRRQGNRRAMALAAGLPLVAGIGLSLATGMWMYLGFTAISAMSILVPLIAGRKGRLAGKLAISRAVQDDIERRHRCSPSAAELVLAVHHPSPVEQLVMEPATRDPAVTRPAASAAESHAHGPDVWLRIGVTQTVANIRLTPDDPDFRQPTIGAAAITLDPRYPEVALCGQPDHTDGLLRFLLMQLASFPAAAETPVVVFGRAGRLPLSARFLPRVTLAISPETVLAALHRGSGKMGGRLFMVDDFLPDDAELWSSLLKAARSSGWQVLHCCVSLQRSAVVVEISPSGSAGYVETDGERRSFVPDLVSAQVFDRFCRKSSATSLAEDPGQGAVIPEECSLAELLPHGQRRVLRKWTETSGRNGPIATLGKGVNGH